MTTDSANRTSYYRGIGLLLAAALLWSLNGAFIKVLIADGSGPTGLAIAMYRSLFAGLFLFPFAVRRFSSLLHSDPANPRKRTWIPLLICVASFTLMTSCFVIANTKTAAANAIILQYTSTLWVFALSPFVLRESANPRDFGALGLALVGIVVIFAGSMSTDLIGLIIALGAGLFYGLLTLCLRSLRHAHPVAVTVMNNLGAALLILPIALVTGEAVVDVGSILILSVMGIVQLGLPYVLFSMALGKVPASSAAILTMLEPLLVPLWTYLAVGEIPSPYTFVGGAIILAALGLVVAR